MTSITEVNHGEQAAKLADAAKGGAKTLASGLNVPEGTHQFLVADTQAFGILNIKSASSGNWALPIVAGTMKLEDNTGKETFELSTRPGAKNLVVPDAFFIQMQPNANYLITIEMRKGRKVVANVQAEQLEENIIPDSKVRTAPLKKKELAF